MPVQIHQLIENQARENPEGEALVSGDVILTYAQLWAQVQQIQSAYIAQGLQAGERVATYLPKTVESVVSLFAASAAGLVFVPVNPVLKPAQVSHILQDCSVKLLVTAAPRLTALRSVLTECSELNAVVLTGSDADAESDDSAYNVLTWTRFIPDTLVPGHRRIDSDIAAILYTSGSTGKPKGVVLSHRNMLAGAESVSDYLCNVASDRVLAVLPLSFDAGLSQLTTVFHVGACAVIMDYLLPADVWRAVERHQITGLAGVPPLWNQLVGLNVDTLNLSSLRYITSTGGAMPLSTTKGLSDKLPGVDIFLMYGLTEAFRSTYLPPDQVAVRPLSIGKAIPNAEILVVNKTGQECAPGEPGELVHRGALVAMGYWNAPEKTAERFKPCPGQDPSLPLTEMAVWSGDRVVKDEEGYLFFVSRQDEMIKTSGYRVSPTEVEEVVYASGLVQEAVAIGLSHPALGQAILVCAVAGTDVAPNELGDNVLRYCRKELPGFMVPQALEVTASLPRNPNGKIDRKSLSDQYQQYFEESSGEA